MALLIYLLSKEKKLNLFHLLVNIFLALNDSYCLFLPHPSMCPHLIAMCCILLQMRLTTDYYNILHIVLSPSHPYCFLGILFVVLITPVQ